VIERIPLRDDDDDARCHAQTKTPNWTEYIVMRVLDNA
jgi:hypothetical protein